MKGIINILKPPGMTSHDVISFMRRLLNMKKIGHSGTLDPAAAGVLPVFVGKATKSIQFFEHDDKEYMAEISFGIVTDTGDVEGEILRQQKADVKLDKLNEALLQFTGEIPQIPPMYSAVRHNGRKLYELARQGIVVERKPRIVKIKELELIDFMDNIAVLRVCCSKGTYIRTLASDIGEKLGCGACLSSLVRIRSGFFNISDSFTLEEVKEKAHNNQLSSILLPIDEALQHLPKVKIPKSASTFIKGKVLPGDTCFSDNAKKGLVRVYSAQGNFLGIAQTEEQENRTVLRVVKLLQ